MTANGNVYNITIFFDAMLSLWSLYAFFMILGLSSDIMGTKTAKTFRRVSRSYLYLSFCLLGMLAFILYYSVFQIQAIGLLVLFSSWLLFWSGKKVYLWIKKTHELGLSSKSEFSNLFKKFGRNAKKEWYQFLFSGFLVCFMLVVAGTHEEFVIPSSVIGSIFLILFLWMRERRKQKGEDTSSNEVQNLQSLE